MKKAFIVIAVFIFVFSSFMGSSAETIDYAKEDDNVKNAGYDLENMISVLVTNDDSSGNVEVRYLDNNGHDDWIIDMNDILSRSPYNSVVRVEKENINRDNVIRYLINKHGQSWMDYMENMYNFSDNITLTYNEIAGIRGIMSLDIVLPHAVVFQRGDINMDMLLDFKDVLMIRQKLASSDTFSKQAKYLSDVNQDTRIDLKDVLSIRKYLAHIIENF